MVVGSNHMKSNF